MSEWLKVPLSKSGVPPKGTEGSNPSLSARREAVISVGYGRFSLRERFEHPGSVERKHAHPASCKEAGEHGGVEKRQRYPSLSARKIKVM